MEIPDGGGFGFIETLSVASFMRLHVTKYIYVLAAVFLGPLVLASGAESTTVAAVDAAGRRVTVQTPVERVVVINTSSAIIMRAIGVDIGRKIVGVTSYITENPRFWPLLKDKPSFRFTSINYETLAELDPQLIILYRTSPLHTDEDKLRALNVKWLYLDCNDPRTLARDIRTLGRLFGKMAAAESLIDWVEKYDRLISGRVRDLSPEDRPRIFYWLFVHANQPKGIYNTINNRSALTPMMEKAGGANIAADMAPDHPKLSPEWLLEKNPDVVMGDVIGKTITGYNVDAPRALENMRRWTGRILNDKALKNTDAVKNGRVMLIAQDLKQGPAYVVGMAYFARFLHPDVFRDVDPEAIAREYYERWCGLPYRGVYVYPPQPAASPPGKPSRSTRKASSRITVIDSADRKVDISLPVRKIAGLHTSACNAFCLLELEEKVVGVTQYLGQDPNMYPTLKNKPNIGSVYSPNYEIILENRPDLLIMGSAAVNLEPATDTLTPLGVPVLALDLQPRNGADAHERERHYDHELMLLAKLTGKADRAQAFIEWKQGVFEMIRRRVRGVKKRRVLCVNSVSKVLKGSGFSVWAGERIIELAGGVNLAAEYEGKTVSGEWVLEQNPDVLVVVSYWPHEGLGHGVEDVERVKKTLAAVSKNKVFARTRAVRKGRLYLFSYYGLASGGQTPVGALYLAKRLYPERFADVDPTTYHKEFLERWFHAPWQGVWFYP